MAATFVSDILSDLDEIRGLAGELGLRPWTVKVTVRTWTGTRPGLGTKTDVTTLLTNNPDPAFKQNIRVQFITQKDIIASGGQYRDRDMRVGPITPTFAASIGLPSGGFGDATIDLAVQTSPTEIFWNVAGPGMPPGGGSAEKIGEEVSALHYYVVLRAEARKP